MAMAPAPIVASDQAHHERTEGWLRFEGSRLLRRLALHRQIDLHRIVHRLSQGVWCSGAIVPVISER